MNRYFTSLLVAVLLLAVPRFARAEPVVIDLGPERLQYERAVTNRSTGWWIVGAAAVAGVVSVYGLVDARAAQSELDAQRPPIDVAARSDLIARGERANKIGAVAGVAGLALGVVGGYFLTISF